MGPRMVVRREKLHVLDVCAVEFCGMESLCNILYDSNVFSGDTLSFIGDQTSYMSICIGEGQEDSLSLLSAQELRQKVNMFK